jgi:hypothetical protein
LARTAAIPGGIARIRNDARAAKTRFYVLISVEHCTGAVFDAVTARHPGAGIEFERERP